MSHSGNASRSRQTAAGPAELGRSRLPVALKADLATHLERLRAQHARDLSSMGHAEVTRTMIYTHVLNRGPAGGQSPADRPLGG